MLLGEPQRTTWDLNFSLFGIPVRVHPFFWLIAVLLGPYMSGLREVAVWVLAVLLGIVVHEMGHAVMMRAYGFSPWITLYGLGGLASYNPAQGYRSRGSDTMRQVLISAAGPAAGFLLAAFVVGVLLLARKDVVVLLGAPTGIMVGTRDVIGQPLFSEWINYLLFVCVAWGILNLLPVYPLDGGQIARELLLKLNPREGIRQSLILSIITAAGLAVYSVSQQNWFLAFLFGFLAYSAYATLQAYSSHGGWR